MKNAEREKICISCEGRISVDAATCPFCATEQENSALTGSFQTPLFQTQSLEDSLSSLYTPPYQGKRPQFGQAEEEAQQADLFEDEPMYKEAIREPQENLLASSEEELEEEEAEAKSTLWPTLMLMAGANFAVLGLMQLLFSSNGVFRLEWNAKFWFFYLLLSAPLLYFGRKKLHEL